MGEVLGQGTHLHRTRHGQDMTRVVRLLRSFSRTFLSFLYLVTSENIYFKIMFQMKIEFIKSIHFFPASWFPAPCMFQALITYSLHHIIPARVKAALFV